MFLDCYLIVGKASFLGCKLLFLETFWLLELVLIFLEEKIEGETYEDLLSGS